MATNPSDFDNLRRDAANQFAEDELPERLQQEFSKLSEGVLSNVALATIASIRYSTHHVLSKFSGRMDSPFFHHRALIKNPDDAEEYAVNIVLSELKKAFDRQQVGATHAGVDAIGARIRELAEGLGNHKTLTLHYQKKKGPGIFKLGVELAIQLVTDGLCTFNNIIDQMPPNPPAKKEFKKYLSTLFSGDKKKAHSQMHQFAALTGVRAYPGSFICQSGAWFPTLGLGTIIRDENKNYLMCLQASCDSVRLENENNFIFVGLEVECCKPEHAIPIPSDKVNRFEYIGLSTSNESYRATRVIKFSASQETKTVNAQKDEHKSILFFNDTKGKKYLWVADLKRRRALRTVQSLGQNMGRLGFDEFEPYRR